MNPVAQVKFPWAEVHSSETQVDFHLLAGPGSHRRQNLVLLLGLMAQVEGKHLPGRHAARVRY